jgi:hypothetical protein
MARPRPHARHHPPLMPLADSAWPHRLPSSAPSVRLAIQCSGLLPSARHTPAPPLRPPPRARRQRGAASGLGRWAVAGSSSRFRRGLGLLQARDSGLTGRLRPADGAAAGVRRSRRPAPGALPCGHRGAPEVGRRAPPDPRFGPGAGSPSARARRGWTGGRPGAVFLCASGPARPRRRACRATHRRATAGGLHPGPAVGHAERAADGGRQRQATIPLAHSPRRR